MTIKKLFIGMTAAVMAASCMAISASAATKLTDYAHPDEADTEMNDKYYSVGAMGFYMNQTWKWNQGGWVGIDDEGKMVIEYKINKVLTDTTMEGKGTLGDMGVMICNLPEEESAYPMELKIPECRFVGEDGTEINFESITSKTEWEMDPEGGIRIHIRPTDEVDEATGEVTKKACPEVAGMDEEGKFNGGTLYVTLDFGPIGSEDKGGDSSTAAGDSSSSKADDSSSKADDSSKKDTASSTTSNPNSGSSSSAASDKADNTSPETGAVEDLMLASMAVAAAATVISKRRN